MTSRISQRGGEDSKTAQTSLSAAETMTDRAVAAQLKSLADDYQRRTEKASRVDVAKAFARSDASADEWPTCQPAEEMRGEPRDARCASQSRAFYPFVAAR
jgi:aminopeptidase N